jgi:uncharacterized protein YjbI with pentapeptide repeats
VIRPRAKTVGRVDSPTLAYTTLTGHVQEIPAGLSRLRLDRAQLRGVSFRGRSLEAFSLVGPSTLEGCDFTNASFSEVHWSSGPTTIWRGCVFEGTRFPREMQLAPVRFERCHFGGRLDKMFAFAGEFVDCTFTGRLEDCTFFGQVTGAWARSAKNNRSANEIIGNDFTEATLVGVGFRHGVPLHAQRFPAGMVIVADVSAALQRLGDVIDSITEGTLRQRLTGMLRGRQRDLDHGQLEWLFNPKDLPAMPAEIRTLVLEAVGAG